jgi:hypothetical protein
VQSNVGTCTLLLSTSWAMKASRLGRVGSSAAHASAANESLVGVGGGEGSAVGGGPHWMTATASWARYAGKEAQGQDQL